MMRRMSTILSIAFKRLYPDNFGRALKLMTFVQTGSIHIDGFKNIKKINKVFLMLIEIFTVWKESVPLKS